MSLFSKKPNVDVGILTIREDEFLAVLEQFPEGQSIFKGKNREYAIRSASAGDENKYTVAVVRQTEQGNGEAQSAARDMLDDLRPALLMVVGIAGGIPSEDFTLGDVVISTRVNDFSVEARKVNSAPTYSMSGGPIHRKMAAKIANLPAREHELKGWSQNLGEKPKVQYTKKGSLYGPTKWQSELKEKLDSHFRGRNKSRVPIFTAGAIASSDRLIKDPKVLFPWVTTSRHLLAVEMESGGVYRAAQDRCLMVSIRGISDIIGLKRSNDWTKYACKSAAAFAKAYLKTGPVPVKKKVLEKLISKSKSSENESKETLESVFAEQLFSNLIPLEKFPQKIYVGQSIVANAKQAWAVLLQGKNSKKGTSKSIPNAWGITEKSVYSFVNPELSPLKKIVELSEVEAIDSKEFAFSKDQKKRRIFLQLLKGALRDDLYTKGLRYFSDDDIFAFVGDFSERKYTYQNVKQESTITVVSKYGGTTKEGKKFEFLRHLAFKIRFRLIEDKYFVELNPTYRFTNDGRNKYFFHEKQLQGIKRLESNRAVLSQVLLGAFLLKQPSAEKSTGLNLEFGPIGVFEYSQSIQDGELESIESAFAETTEDEAIRL